MNHAWDVTFGIVVHVHAETEADALRAAATLVAADPAFYATAVTRWEGDQANKPMRFPTLDAVEKYLGEGRS